MMQRKKKILTFIWLFTTVFSYTQDVGFIEFQALIPPKAVLPPDAKTMAFVDRNIYFNSDKLGEVYVYMKKMYKDTTRYDSVMSVAAFKGFKRSISELYQFDSIPLIVLSKTYINDDSTNIRQIPPLSWDVVDSICDATYSDILVSLEDMLIFTTYKLIGNTYRHYYGGNEIIVWSKWRIYDPFTRKIYDNHTTIDSLFLEEIGATFEELKNKLPSRRSIMEKAAYYIGSNYAERISPLWIDAERMYYKKDDKRMTQINKLIKEEKWEQCKSIWKDIFLSTDKFKIKGRVAYNMAVVNEITGDILIAEDWIAQSIKSYKKVSNKLEKELKFAQFYQEIIKVRKEEIRRIKEIFESID